MMIPELGLMSLVLAFCMACILAGLPMIRLNSTHSLASYYSKPLLWGQSAFVLLGFSTLVFCFLFNDFSVEYVALNSNTKLPLVYKFCAIWGAHEGSLLLWILILSLWMIFAAKRTTGLLDIKEQGIVFAVLGAVSAGFLFLLLNTSNPFARLLPSTPLEGSDLNPLLQDPGFVIHPPFLYMGYVGFAVPFAFSLAALIQGNMTNHWVKLARPFALFAWGCLTIGIVLGSWWAYYELGWGGWWFWDPVENASLMPWLMGGALCHSLLISSERQRFLPWSHLLAIGTFILSLIGTFLVRSGILSSVHAFASDPKRGSFILAFILIVLILSFGIYIRRFTKHTEVEPLKVSSKEAGILMGNIILVVMTLTILLGTLYPLAMEVFFHKRLSVGPPYFRAIFTPLMIPLLLLMSVVPYLYWGQDSARVWFKRLQKPFIFFLLLVLAGGMGSYFIPALSWYDVAAVMLGIWLIIATIYKQTVFYRGQGRWGMLFAHSGLGIAVIGMVLVNALEIESEVRVNIGETIEVGKKDFVFNDIQPNQGANFEGRRGHFTIQDRDKVIGRLFPEKRYFHARDSVMTETAIKPGFFQDYYIALGEPYEDGSWSVRIYIKPFVRWIWLGGLMIAFGAILTSMISLQRTRGKHV